MRGRKSVCYMYDNTYIWMFAFEKIDIFHTIKSA